MYTIKGNCLPVQVYPLNDICRLGIYFTTMTFTCQFIFNNRIFPTVVAAYIQNYATPYRAPTIVEWIAIDFLCVNTLDKYLDLNTFAVK